MTTMPTPENRTPAETAELDAALREANEDLDALIDGHRKVTAALSRHESLGGLNAVLAKRNDFSAILSMLLAAVDRLAAAGTGTRVAEYTTDSGAIARFEVAP